MDHEELYNQKLTCQRIRKSRTNDKEDHIEKAEVLRTS